MCTYTDLSRIDSALKDGAHVKTARSFQYHVIRNSTAPKISMVEDTKPLSNLMFLDGAPRLYSLL